MNRSHPFGRRNALLAAMLFVISQPIALAQEATGPETWPNWLQQEMAKESRKSKKTRISVGDGFFESQLLGKSLGGPQAIEGGWYLSSDIGTPTPLECWVFSTTVDPATMASNIAEVSMQSAAKQHGSLRDRRILFIDAGAYDGAPFLALEWFYTVGEAPEARAGLAKVRVAMRNGVTLACAHNLVGYRETFAKAFERFVRSAKFPGMTPSHQYEEVVVQKIGEQRIGVALTTYTKDKQGDTEILLIESALIPVDGSNLATSDTWHSSFSRPDGTLINQVSAKSENGELTMQLSLDPMDSGGWSVSGIFQGKQISEKISDTAQPMSDIGQKYAVQRLLADSESNDIKLDVWVPSADPTRFIQAGVSLDQARPQKGFGTLTIGPLAIAGRFDAEGSLINGRMQVGGAEISLERIWADGELP